MKQRIVLVLTAGLLVFAAWGIAHVTWTVFRPANELAPEDVSPRPSDTPTPTRSRAALSETRFLSPDACAVCHRDIVEQFSRSAMSRSWRSASSPGADVRLAEGSVQDDPGGYRYRIFHEGHDWWVEESLSWKLLDQPHRLRKPVDYLIGSGTHAFAVASRQDNAIHMMPVAWFHAEERWRFTPGYEQQNLRFSRPVTEACIACHGTYADARVPTVNQYEGPVVDGIRCERCHGSGVEHVRHWREQAAASKLDGIGDGDRSPSAASSARAEGGASHRPATNDSDIVNPARLSAERANDVCFQCHLQGIVPLVLPGKNSFSFRPGDRLSDHRLDFLLDEGNPSSFGVAAHGARMMQSRCFTASGGNLRCIGCHDPHRPVSDFPRGTYDQHCLTCHTTESCSRPAAARPPGPGTASCTRCHMPQRGTHEGQHLVFTDHWIRRDTGTFQPEPAVLAADAPIKLAPVWPAADPDRIRLGSAYVWIHEAIGPQRRAAETGVLLLTQARAAGKSDPASDYWLASGLLALGRPREACQILELAAASSPSGPFAAEPRLLWKLGIAARQVNNRTRALQCFEQCSREFPYWEEALEQLAFLQLEAGRFEDAARTLRQQLEHRTSAQALTNLAIALAETGRSEESDGLLDEALRLDPKFLPAYLNRAWVSQRRGDRAKAARWYQAALTLDPGNRQAAESLDALKRLAQ